MTQPTFYPSHCWVPQGCFELVPKRAVLNANYAQLLNEEAKKARRDLRAAKAAAAAAASEAAGAGPSSSGDAEADRIDRKYNLQDYDNEDGTRQEDIEIEDDEDDEDEEDIVGHASDGEEDDDDDANDEDDEDLRLQATDNLVIVAQVQPSDCVSEAQIHVYNEPDKQFYEHRCFYLDSMPLCFDWVGRGHLLAVGRMEPQVQLWDLDLRDALLPAALLEGHTDAVLDVAWNPRSPQALASASADRRVGLWDLDAGRCVRMLEDLHTDKAQALAWHPQESNLLLTGSYDSTARLVDCRAPASAGTGVVWQLDGECERLAWDRRNPLFLLAGTEKGSVQRCDARVQGGAPVSTLAAHAGACCGLAVTDHLLCTGGADGLAKVWRANQNGDWKLLASRDWGVGEVTKLTANPDCQCVLGITGMSGFQVWDVRENPEARAYLASRGATIPDA